jgi:hypothetical protein
MARARPLRADRPNDRTFVNLWNRVHPYRSLLFIEDSGPVSLA